jgi:transposase
MKHRLGLSYGKVRCFFAAVFTLLISRGAFARADARLARRLQPTCGQLVIGLRQQEAVYGDETGWKVGGHSAWLWVFTSVEITVYVTAPTRAHQVVERMLGAEYAGRLDCDCFLGYDPLAYPQQKYLGHLLRTCAQIAESKSRGAARFSRWEAQALRAALRLKERQGQMRAHGYAVACGRLEA